MVKEDLPLSPSLADFNLFHTSPVVAEAKRLRERFSLNDGVNVHRISPQTTLA